MWPFTPTWNSNNEAKAIRAVANVTDQETLALVAKTAWSSSVRLEAIKKLVNIEVLACLLEDKNALVNSEAKNGIQNIFEATGDEAYLASYARGHCDPFVRMAATRNITDQDTLYDIVMNDDILDIRIMALNKIHDQTLLSAIAANGIDVEIRLVAAKMIYDEVLRQNIYVDIIRKYDTYSVRADLVKELNENAGQENLAEIATLPPPVIDTVGRYEVVSGPYVRIVDILLHEKEWLKYVAERAEDENVNFAAKLKLLGHITEEVKLAEIAKTDENLSIRIWAVEKLADQKVLAEIAFNGDEHVVVRGRAIQKINDQNVLTRIALNDRSHHIKLEAIEKLTNQEVLIQIALGNYQHRPECDVTLCALRKLTAPSSLAVVAKRGLEEVALEAVRTIEDDEILIDIAMTGECTPAQVEAIKKVSDPALLVEVAAFAADLYVRETAGARVLEPELWERILSLQQKRT